MASIFAALTAAWKDKQAAGKRFRAGNRFYQQGKFEDAVREYSEAVTLAPALPLARINLGLALYKSGRKREGREQWQHALALVEGKNSYLTEQVKILLRQFA